MMISLSSSKNSGKRDLSIEEVRLISDLRIMHAKVHELHEIVRNLTERHREADICSYADAPVLASDINKVDAIYLWFVKLKGERDVQRRANESNLLAS